VAKKGVPEATGIVAHEEARVVVDNKQATTYTRHRSSRWFVETAVGNRKSETEGREGTTSERHGLEEPGRFIFFFFFFFAPTLTRVELSDGNETARPPDFHGVAMIAVTESGRSPRAELSWEYALRRRAGRSNVNKVAKQVHAPLGGWGECLPSPDDAKARFDGLPNLRTSPPGEFLVTSQEYRDQ